MKKDKTIFNEFKKWSKDKSFIFSEDLYTQLLNINNSYRFDKWYVEMILFSLFTDNGKEIWKDHNLSFKKDDNVVNWLKEIFNKLTDINVFEKFFVFLDYYLEYRNKGEKNMKVEYEILNKYWDWVNELYEKNIEGFNKWILTVNKIVYIKQKGFRLD